MAKLAELLSALGRSGTTPDKLEIVSHELKGVKSLTVEAVESSLTGKVPKNTVFKAKCYIENGVPELQSVETIDPIQFAHRHEVAALTSVIDRLREEVIKTQEWAQSEVTKMAEKLAYHTERIAAMEKLLQEASKSSGK